MNDVVSFAHDSAEPLGGVSGPIWAASRAYSLVSPWIVSQSGFSACKSLPITGVIEFGPLASLLMICSSVPLPRLPAGPPIAGPGRLGVPEGPPPASSEHPIEPSKSTAVRPEKHHRVII